MDTDIIAIKEQCIEDIIAIKEQCIEDIIAIKEQCIEDIQDIGRGIRSIFTFRED